MTIIPRKLSGALATAMEYYPIVTLLGPRQSGKSTLVTSMYPDKPYINLEDPMHRRRVQADPKAFLDEYHGGAIIDEIQRVPELLSYLQVFVDQNPSKGAFILTGSHQLALSQGISPSLAGRTAVLTLQPLSLQELGQNLPFEAWAFKGFYPKVHKEPTDPLIFFRDYVATYLERDVRQMTHVQDLALFQDFLIVCASRIGQLLDAESLSHDLGVSTTQIKQWLSILEASFIVTRLRPYYQNIGKKITKRYKIYFNDVGLVSYLLEMKDPSHIKNHPLRGALFENLVVMEVFKAYHGAGQRAPVYFYRDQERHEIDLLIKKSQGLVPIEIKSSKTFHPDFLKELRYFKSMLLDQCLGGHVIYSGEKIQRIEDFSILHFNEVSSLAPE